MTGRCQKFKYSWSKLSCLKLSSRIFKGYYQICNYVWKFLILSLFSPFVCHLSFFLISNYLLVSIFKVYAKSFEIFYFKQKAVWYFKVFSFRDSRYGNEGNGYVEGNWDDGRGRWGFTVDRTTSLPELCYWKLHFYCKKFRKLNYTEEADISFRKFSGSYQKEKSKSQDFGKKKPINYTKIQTTLV